MCRRCELPYEPEGIYPAGPRAASAVPGLCVSCWADMHECRWWECLPWSPTRGERVRVFLRADEEMAAYVPAVVLDVDADLVTYEDEDGERGQLTEDFFQPEWTFQETNR